ncbi:hypothetical protein DEAC_c17350 [Desulfosporosinus acididurans]|uniref:Radical SAM superfamily protein n=1 Tax=Desulfosporosinus acididurans TaxID=476652 RepID=A0A0J1INT7_9FIRM|nr:hypothetical protein [Desulfosporosinus acididurans]KLU66336.1 hypothetical protein DEAC_c17350 [Desulfosporosinus acididurans]
MREIKIARVFPRITKATPTDELVFYGCPPMFMPDIDEVHISVSFTYDMKQAEWLAKQWEMTGLPVKIGGPAFDAPGGDFIPGMYIKQGYVITSRGCPNNCWFCRVPVREGGQMRELEIHEGNNVLDDNLLACSDNHIKAVFEMLKHQKLGRPMFTGGLEAKRLKDWHVKLLRDLKPKEIFFAYDTPDDYEPLLEAGKKLLAAGFTTTSQTLRPYVLIGYPADTFNKAEARLLETIRAGFVPMAMLYRDKEGKVSKEWEKFQRFWARPATVNLKIKEIQNCMV